MIKRTIPQRMLGWLDVIQFLQAWRARYLPFRNSAIAREKEDGRMNERKVKR